MKALTVNFYILFLSLNIVLKPQTAESYFPLAIGNEWHFNSNLFPQTEIITDTIRINGTLYYGLAAPAFDPYFFIREWNNQLFALDLSDTAEVLLFDFNADEGDSWDLTENFNCNYGVKVTLESKDDTIETPLGTFYGCYHFTHLQYCMDGGIIDTWFVKGIGKVAFMEMFFAGLGDFVLDEYKIVTSSDEPGEQPGISFILYQNYPNPFNLSTRIKFMIPPTGDPLTGGLINVQLKVFDILGREVATLVNEEKQPGEYEVDFRGDKLPSGVYVYKLKGEKFSQTRKIMLVK